MRFRATIENVDTFASKSQRFVDCSILTSTEIVQSVEKLQKKCTIKFAEHEMRIICAGDVNEGGIQVWSYVLHCETDHMRCLTSLQADQSLVALHRIPHTVQQ